MDILRKHNGKSSAIKIDDDVRNEIKSFKEHLQSLQDDEVRAIDKVTIDVIMNELDDYDRNILLAFYSVAQSSHTTLGRMLGVSYMVATYQIKRIQKNVRNRVMAITADNSIYN